jgi:hypothetical protein
MLRRIRRGFPYGHQGAAACGDNAPMFAPSQEEVRRFFCAAYRKALQAQPPEPLTPLEALAADWIAAHPEYHAELADLDAALARDYRVEDGRSNPFLHLAMHLSLSEQLSIDQPPGVRAAFERLAARLGEAHAAQHAMMDCLGEMLWRAQRSGLPPDAAAYLDCLRRKAGGA